MSSSVDSDWRSTGSRSEVEVVVLLELTGSASTESPEPQAIAVTSSRSPDKDRTIESGRCLAIRPAVGDLMSRQPAFGDRAEDEFQHELTLNTDEKRLR